MRAWLAALVVLGCGSTVPEKVSHTLSEKVVQGCANTCGPERRELARILATHGDTYECFCESGGTHFVDSDGMELGRVWYKTDFVPQGVGTCPCGLCGEKDDGVLKRNPATDRVCECPRRGIQWNFAPNDSDADHMIFRFDNGTTTFNVPGDNTVTIPVR